jgi:hypothetical protein
LPQAQNLKPYTRLTRNLQQTDLHETYVNLTPN